MRKPEILPRVRPGRVLAIQVVLAAVLLAGLSVAGFVVIRAFYHTLPEEIEGRAPASASAKVGPQVTAREGKASADALLTLNEHFRQAYRNARAETLTRVGPVILLEGDTLVLLRRSTPRREASITPAEYTTLKSVSHVPLGIYVQLAPHGEARLVNERLAQLRTYRDQVAAALPVLENLGLQGETVLRQRQILTDSLRFLDHVLDQHQVTRADLTAFTRQLGPALLANAQEAAQLQITALHAQTMKWRHEMSPEDWKALRVVVMGSPLPRQGNLAVQYFARVLGEPGEGKRIIYAESQWDEPKALDLLGTHLLDAGIGESFFGDDRRMHRDLLSDAAAAYLKQLPVEQP
jgi:hypothetical protein